MNGTILLTGGAGFIGSHVNLALHEQGYDTVILDDLSRGSEAAVLKGHFYRGDFADSELLEELFKKYAFKGVIHFAAWTDVGESVRNPGPYYENNVTKTLRFLQAVKGYKCPVVFSSSAAVYGIPETPTVSEEAPKVPINPYGATKLMCEQILHDFGAYGIRSISLRYFNAAGGDPEGRLKNTKPEENNLIPIVLRKARDGGSVTIFGTDYDTPDGTCVRDYIHVMDLASAHILALQKLINGDPSDVFNLGIGRGFSVREVIEMAKKVTGISFPVIEGARREGDPPTLLADSAKAKEKLGWTPRYTSLEQIIQDAWKSYTSGT